MDNYDVMSCPNCEAADREIDKLEARLDAADQETLAAWEIDRARLTAADALAEAMEPLSHFLDTFKNVEDNLALWFYSDGKEVVTVGDFRRVVEALREYREVSGA